MEYRIMPVAEYLFLAGVFLKQFYMEESGAFQIADMFMMAAFLVLLCFKQLFIQEIDKNLFLFVSCTFIINTFYLYFYKDGGISMSSGYLLYNFLIIIMFRTLALEPIFLSRFSLVLKLNLLTQLFLLFLHRDEMGSGGRWHGSFNDPNQFAFFVMSCFMMTVLCSQIFRNRFPLEWYLVSVILIAFSGSTGMVLGMVAMTATAILLPFFDQREKNEKIVIFVIVITIGAFLYLNRYLLLSLLEYRSNRNEVLHLAYMRIKEKVGRVSGLDGYLHERILYRIVRAPEYFIMGSGEERNDRVRWLSGEHLEMHSTMIAMCYYYGIIPYMLFLGWIHRNLSGIPGKSVCVYVGIIAEAFTLANHRQPFFWIIFVLGSVLVRNNEIQKQEQAVEIQRYRYRIVSERR